MTNYSLMFTNPWLLFLLIPALGFAIAPLFFVQKKYRTNRNRIVSLILHSTAMVLAVFLLAGCTYSYDIPNKENELILLVDCSDSNTDAVVQKDEFIQSVVDLCGDDYKLGIVKFGYDQLYVAHLSNDTDEVYQQYIESMDPDTSATDIASALQYAKTLFKNPTSGKIVVISDGIETDGSALSVIKSISAEGIKVDTACYPNDSNDEVQIVGATLPEYKIVADTPFTITLTLKSNISATDINDLERTMTYITVYDNGTPSGPFACMLEGGEQTVEITHMIAEKDLVGMHTLKFEISNTADTSSKNNSYYTYLRLDDLNNILLIERRSGESQHLQDLLSENELNVTALGIDTDFAKIPNTVKELCRYEQVVLVNIANSDLPTGFDELLYQYVNKFGGGLFTVGGENDEGPDGELIPHAYDKEDLANKLLSEMLPVQAIDYTPPVAVMIVIDCSGSMSGKFEYAQIGAKACLDALTTRDFCGVMSFNTSASETMNVIPVSQKDKIVKAIDEVNKNTGESSGGTVYADAIDIAGRALATVQVERRHIIIVSDGKPTDDIEKYGPYIDNNVKDGITMSIVGIQTDNTDVQNMEETCKRGNGKFYNVPTDELNTLPSIMHDDMVMEAIDGIQYGEEFVPQIKDHTSLFAGINQEDVPPLTGYYGTRLKDEASAPLMGEYVPIYAQWKFGEGIVGSFMSDLDGIWSEKFLADEVGKKMIVNIVKNIFPLQALKTDEIDALLKQDNYKVQVSVASKREEGETVGLTVTPLSEEAIAFYQDEIPVAVADGFTRFTFDITCPGVYQITIDKKSADGTVLASLSMDYAFSYSQEYNYFPQKEPIGEEYMSALATDGRGIAVEFAIDIFDSFDKTIHRDIDPRIGMLIAIIILFLLDVAVRKFKFKWPHELVKEYKEKKAEEAKRHKE